MNPPIGLNHCLTFINTQLQPPHAAATNRNGIHLRAITISRQTGSGGHQVAQKLLELLQPHSLPESPPWTIFDRNLVVPTPSCAWRSWET